MHTPFFHKYLALISRSNDILTVMCIQNFEELNSQHKESDNALLMTAKGTFFTLPSLSEKQETKQHVHLKFVEGHIKEQIEKNYFL